MKLLCLSPKVTAETYAYYFNSCSKTSSDFDPFIKGCKQLIVCALLNVYFNSLEGLSCPLHKRFQTVIYETLSIETKDDFPEENNIAQLRNTTLYTFYITRSVPIIITRSEAKCIPSVM